MKVYPLLTLLIGASVFYACGGKNSVGTQNTAGLSSATFSAIKAEVLTPNCAISGCHNGVEQPNMSAGVAYGNIVNAPSSQSLDYIEPGNSGNSYLYRKLNGSGIAGNRMPRNASPLSSAAIDSIAAWIDRGALNN